MGLCAVERQATGAGASAGPRYLGRHPGGQDQAGGLSGAKAEEDIRALLAATPERALAELGITRKNGDFAMPVRTTLIVGRKG